jgi:hypothetical protein
MGDTEGVLCNHSTLYKRENPVYLAINRVLVPGAGIEPALPNGNRILSPARLPVPPSGPPWCLRFLKRMQK